MPRTRPFNPTTDERPARIAALHRQGGAWRVVVAQTDPGPGETGLRAVEGRSFPLGDLAGVQSALTSQRVEVLVRVVPSARTICRAAALPDGEGGEAGEGDASDPSALLEALSLLAEAELPPSVPPHRRAAGVIRPGGAEGSRAAMLVAWPEGSPDDDERGFGSLPEVWTAEAAALAALGEAVGGAGQVVYADREAGSIAIVAASRDNSADEAGNEGAGVVVRVMRADASDPAAWRSSVLSVSREAAAALHADPPAIRPGTGDHALLLLDAARPAPLGAPTDPAWLSTYGVALGAILALADPDPAARSLLTLRPNAADERASFPDRALAWLSAPRHAYPLLAACALALLLGPLAAAYARSAVLERKTGGLTALRERLDEARRRSAFHDVLQSRRWPMAKLLADVAGAAPVGVTLGSVTLALDESLVVRGEAESADLVTAFAAHLTATSVFDALSTPSIDAGRAGEDEGSGVEFQLEARVARPLLPAKPAADFAAEPLAVRLYGEAAPGSDANTRLVDHARNGEKGPSADRSLAPARDRRRPALGQAGERERGEPQVRGPAPAEAPPPLTDADIAAMDRTAAMKEWTRRLSLSKRAEFDEETRRRLADEAERCKQRMTAAREEGP